MLSIDIYSDFAIEYEIKGACISQEDSTPDDIQFHHYEHKYINFIDGGKLLDIISKKLVERDISEFKIKDDKIIFEYFNPMNGEASTDVMTIKRVMRVRRMEENDR